MVSAFSAVIANAVDYFRFRSAVARIEGLPQPELLAMADYARSVKGLSRFAATEAPGAFHSLKSLSGSSSEGICDLLLYELGEVYLWVRVETSPSNQRIKYFTNSGGPQRTKVVWDRSSEFVRSVSPTGRLVTVARWSMYDGQAWIVLKNRICVVHRNSVAGGEDIILASVPLDIEGYNKILAALRTLGPSVRGKDYRADGVADGISLWISFTPSGEEGPEDIAISNTWVEATRPLLDAISKFGPKEFPIGFETIISRDELLSKRPATVRTLREVQALDWPAPKTPWWCVWRSFIR